MRLDELALKVIALEGRINSMVNDMISDREYRREVHTTLLTNQEKHDTRIRALEVKMYMAAGALAALQFILALIKH